MCVQPVKNTSPEDTARQDTILLYVKAEERSLDYLNILPEGHLGDIGQRSILV